MNHFKIIKNAHIYAPKDLGINDILLYGNQIAMIDKKNRANRHQNGNY